MTQFPDIIVLNIGNSRTQIGRFLKDEIVGMTRISNEKPSEIVQQVKAWGDEPDFEPVGIVIASVNDPISTTLQTQMAEQLITEIAVVGDDLAIPLTTQLDPETITGVDRYLNGLAAFELVSQACIVVDAGTAVTVDFIDGKGVFQGGAIAPGALLQLQALHQHADALPELSFTPPALDPFGRSTTQAMLNGVFYGIRGMVRMLAERYAEAYEAYPKIIATGGDAEVLLNDDELIDRIEPNLTLRGIGLAAAAAFSADASASPGD